MEKKNNLLILSLAIMSLLILFTNGCLKTDDNNHSETVTDVDGNVYGTVTIGSQVWMAGNLKTTRYRDGTAIPNVTDGTLWYNLLTGAYCDYAYDPNISATYGRLYNWYAVNSGMLAPVGWHVPSDAEWATLETFLGNDNIMGGKIKETGTAHWQSPNTAATNETGFTALPAGFRSSTGSYFSLTYNGYWWSSTTGSDISYGIYRYVDFNVGSIYRNEDSKVDGLSVRCIRD